MSRIKWMATAAIIAIVLCMGPAQGVEIDWPEPNWPDIFEPNWPRFGGAPNEVLTLYLEMDPSDWTAILRTRLAGTGCIDEKIEKPAYFWMEGEDANKIRVSVRRKKGFAFPDKGQAKKVALKIDINEYYPKQGDPNNCVPGTEPGEDGYCDPNAATDWHGLKKLSLEVNSDSLDVISEGVAINLHTMASLTEGYGWPVWHANWVKLYVNGEYIGVYVNAEQYDKQYMRNRDLYVSHDSWLYKYADCIPGFVLKVGDDDFPRSPALEALCYEPFINPIGADPCLYPTDGNCPVPDDANVVADMNQWVNMERMLTMAAIDAFMANSDPLFESGNNTYFLDWNLADPCETRKRMYFPWDVDACFKALDTDIYYAASSKTYDTVILGNPFFRSQYNQIMRDLLDGPLTFADINDFLDMIEPVITDAVEADTYAMEHIFDRLGLSSAAEVFDWLRSWFSQRIPNVRYQVDWDEPILPPGIVLLDDGFEGGPNDWDANWTGGGGSGWQEDTSTYAHGSASAHAEQNYDGDFNCIALDTNYATAIHIDFWCMKDDTETTDDFRLFYYNGTSYVDVCDLDTLGGDDEWLHFTDTITDSNYFVSDFRIRFACTLETGENVWVDDVVVTKEILDADGDGVADHIDNCPYTSNPGQADADVDGIGDDCECDRANLDGINPVNFGDFAIVGNDWALTGPGLAGDTNWNLVVDREDLAQIAEHWLNDCPP